MTNIQTLEAVYKGNPGKTFLLILSMVVIRLSVFPFLGEALLAVRDVTVDR